ncbi:MAG: DinB family protein [Anaerolineae bacterium]|nr:DinB family protein [Anaerolineae bacterium]
MRSIPKPLEGEFAPYTIMYIGLLPDDGLVLTHMQENLKLIINLIRPLSEAQLTTPFAADEWTIKQILVHIIDDERIYVYRALRAARNDQTELPGFDQDLFTTYSDANQRSLDSIIEEYESVRAATLTLFSNLSDEALTRASIANGHAMSVRAAAYHIAGHELHHINSIKQNYLR